MLAFTERRRALQALGLGVAAAGAVVATGAQAAADIKAPVLEKGASNLRALMERLRRAPRRRDFKTVPMILNEPSQWDDEALREVMAYKPVPKQVWDNTKIESSWLNLMRNSLNAQVWSFKHPGFRVRVRNARIGASRPL